MINWQVKKLNNRANSKANQLGLSGINREVFTFIAVSGTVSFVSLMQQFENYSAEILAKVMAELMESKVVFQMVTCSHYHTVAI